MGRPGQKTPTWVIIVVVLGCLMAAYLCAKG